MALGKIQSNVDIQVIVIIIVIFNVMFSKKTQHICTKPDMQTQLRHSPDHPNKISLHLYCAPTTTIRKKTTLTIITIKKKNETAKGTKLFDITAIPVIHYMY